MRWRALLQVGTVRVPLQLLSQGGDGASGHGAAAREWLCLPQAGAVASYEVSTCVRARVFVKRKGVRAQSASRDGRWGAREVCGAWLCLSRLVTSHAVLTAIHGGAGLGAPGLDRQPRHSALSTGAARRRCMGCRCRLPICALLAAGSRVAVGLAGRARPRSRHSSQASLTGVQAVGGTRVGGLTGGAAGWRLGDARADLYRLLTHSSQPLFSWRTRPGHAQAEANQSMAGETRLNDCFLFSLQPRITRIISRALGRLWLAASFLRDAPRASLLPA